MEVQEQQSSRASSAADMLHGSCGLASHDSGIDICSSDATDATSHYHDTSCSDDSSSGPSFSSEPKNLFSNVLHDHNNEKAIKIERILRTKRRRMSPPKAKIDINDTSLLAIYTFVKAFLDAPSTNAVALDNKIEQAMDLVKSHLMFAVREEVEVLKEKILELVDQITVLKNENSVLRQYAPPEILAQLQQAAHQSIGGGSAQSAIQGSSMQSHHSSS